MCICRQIKPFSFIVQLKMQLTRATAGLDRKGINLTLIYYGLLYFQHSGRGPVLNTSNISNFQFVTMRNLKVKRVIIQQNFSNFTRHLP